MYEITWTEVASHTAKLSPADLAALVGISVAELPEPNDDDLIDKLADGLAPISDDAFEFLHRENIEVTKVETQ